MVEIEDFSFGRMRVQGQDYRQDLKIVDGKVIADWWREHGHKVSDVDVREVFESRPEVLVVGSGLSAQMTVSPTLRDRLAMFDIELVEEPTESAVATYNRLLRQGRRVAGAFHLTC